MVVVVVVLRWGVEELLAVLVLVLALVVALGGGEESEEEASALRFLLNLPEAPRLSWPPAPAPASAPEPLAGGVPAGGVGVGGRNSLASGKVLEACRSTAITIAMYVTIQS